MRYYLRLIFDALTIITVAYIFVVGFLVMAADSAR